MGTSLVVWWLGLCAPNAGGLGSIPGEGIRPHMPQLKILHATMKTQDRQINKNKYFHETKRHLLLGRIPMTNPDSVLKSRDITLLTKVCLVKAMAFQ